MKNINEIIFLDIDATLLDEYQKTNSNKIPYLSKVLKNKKILLGINSNRSIEDILPVVKKFKINGPVIVENGSYMLYQKKKNIFTNTKINELQKQIIKIVQLFCRLNSINYSFTDSVKFIKNIKKNKNTICIQNKFRKYTVSLHVFTGNMRNLKLAQKLLNCVKKQLQGNNKYKVVFSKKSGIITISPKDIGKIKALKILKNIYSKIPFIMIGNGIEDLKTKKVVRKFYTVQNAEKRVKEKADYIALNSYTKGVVEILNKINYSELE